jgi:hypothetical protein
MHSNSKRSGVRGEIARRDNRRAEQALQRTQVPFSSKHLLEKKLLDIASTTRTMACCWFQADNDPRCGRWFEVADVTWLLFRSVAAVLNGSCCVTPGGKPRSRTEPSGRLTSRPNVLDRAGGKLISVASSVALCAFFSARWQNRHLNHGDRKPVTVCGRSTQLVELSDCFFSDDLGRRD